MAELSLKDLIKAVSNMDSNSGVSQSIYVIEECSELIKELMKKERRKENKTNIINEACDVLTMVFVLLDQYGVSEAYIKEQISFKCKRALDRYANDGEV